MTITITVLYPNIPGSHFDVDYYMNTHKPLVESHWGGKGMTSFKALKGAGTADPATPPLYQLIAVIGFESPAAFQNAVKESGAAVLGDIPNFSDVQPIVQINEDLD